MNLPSVDWEQLQRNCNLCGEPWIDAVNAFDAPALVAELLRLRLASETGSWTPAQRSAGRPRRTAPSAPPCGYGGRFSFAARARCRTCGALLAIDSWFHTSALAASG